MEAKGRCVRKSKSKKIECSNALKTCSKIGIESKIFVFVSLIFEKKKKKESNKQYNAKRKNPLLVSCFMHASVGVNVFSWFVKHTHSLSLYLPQYFSCWRSFIRGCDLHFTKTGLVDGE